MTFPCLVATYQSSPSDFDRLPANIRGKVQELQDATRDCTGFLLNICLSYGGRADMANACRDIATAAVKGDISPADICEDTVERFLSTKSIPGAEYEFFL